MSHDEANDKQLFAPHSPTGSGVGLDTWLCVSHVSIIPCFTNPDMWVEVWNNFKRISHRPSSETCTVRYQILGGEKNTVRYFVSAKRFTTLAIVHRKDATNYECKGY